MYASGKNHAVRVSKDDDGDKPPEDDNDEDEAELHASESQPEGDDEQHCTHAYYSYP